MSGSLWTPIILAAASTVILQTPGRALAPPAASAADAPSIFGTIALPLKSTRFDDRWRRVLRSGLAARQLLAPLAAARRVPPAEQLRLVNASVNARIRYRPDIHPSGDHWSTAQQTVGRSAGDCEDYAIAKLQALKALGVPERDLFMTIGHEGSADAVHAVLVARVDGRFFVLDNRTDQLIPHERYGGFYPMLTFGARSSWLHGYERGKTPAAVRAMNGAVRSDQTSLNGLADPAPKRRQ
ncbi:MAG TPA: transglutaminase-like cysteine peptidase [Sphingomicrobium sp.]